MNKLRYLLPIIYYLLIIFYSSRPIKEMPAGVPDYLFHFAEYFLFGLFVAYALPVNHNWKRKFKLQIVLLIVSAALIDETVQLFVPTRVFSVSDLLSDFCGALCGLFAFQLFKKTAQITKTSI